jgi:hypothetical protein
MKGNLVPNMMRLVDQVQHKLQSLMFKQITTFPKSSIVQINNISMFW